MDAGLRVRGKGVEELNLELSSFSSKFMLWFCCVDFFKARIWVRQSKQKADQLLQFAQE